MSDEVNTQPEAAPAPQAQPAPQMTQVAEGPSPAPTPPPQERPVQPVVQLTPEQIAQNKTNQEISTMSDMTSAPVSPKSYHDLWESRSTPGKLGTLFGLLIAGAGSGLTHQPNALLEMMNKEIDRDFEAQKNNRTNKLNWFNSARAYEKQQYDQAAQAAATNATNAATYHSVLDSDLKRGAIQQSGNKYDLSASNKARDALINNQAEATAKNHAIITLGQMWQQNVNNMPEGPQRAVAQDTLNNKVLPSIAEKVHQNNVAAVKKNAMIKAMHDQKQEPTFEGPVDEKKLMGAMASGLADEQTGGITGTTVYKKGSIPTKDHEAIKSDIAAVQKNANDATNWREGFNRLVTQPNAGQAPFVEEGSAILGKIAETLGGGNVSQSVAGVTGGITKGMFERAREVEIGSLKARGIPQDKIDAMVPSWKDFNDPKALARVFEQGNKYFHQQDSEIGKTLNIYDKKLGSIRRPLPEMTFTMPKRNEEKREKSVREMPIYGTH